jgi:hypothetical protein
MTTPLSPIASEFETQEDAERYDRWFREKVRASTDAPQATIPHDEVMAEIEAIIVKAESHAPERRR